jgi:hypothetical protein
LRMQKSFVEHMLRGAFSLRMVRNTIDGFRIGHGHPIMPVGRPVARYLLRVGYTNETGGASLTLDSGSPLAICVGL